MGSGREDRRSFCLDPSLKVVVAEEPLSSAFLVATEIVALLGTIIHRREPV